MAKEFDSKKTYSLFGNDDMQFTGKEIEREYVKYCDDCHKYGEYQVSFNTYFEDYEEVTE